MSEVSADKQLKRKQLTVVLVTLLVIAAVAAILFYVLLNSLLDRDARNERIDLQNGYRYMTAQSSQGMKLHALITKPQNIEPVAINANVAEGTFTGINGGFFYGQDLLSISIKDGKAINGETGAYGSGSENVKYSRGTLVWDGATALLSVQKAGPWTELAVTDASNFWAQGGISMTLNDDSAWREAAILEKAPFPDDLRLRSGAVYDQNGSLYLVVSETKGTLEQFRAAIKEQIGGGKLVDGIFLDGDGSSQLLAGDTVLRGDNRPVVQMLRIVHD
jgi:type II secretory pathway pseudopilin PulG